jgi:coniferyl-aldehyde dehydrogenase
MFCLPEGSTEAFVPTRRVVERYLRETPDYSGIVSDAHFERLRDLLAAQRRTVRQSFHCNCSSSAPTRHAPHAAYDRRHDMRIMREEMFGPILPIRAVSHAR